MAGSAEGTMYTNTVQLMTNIVDCEQTPEALVLDMPLEVTFETATDEITLPKFRPAKS